MVTCATRIALVLALSLAVACGKSRSSSDAGPDAIADTPLAEIDYGTEDAPATDSELPADALEDGTSDAKGFELSNITCPRRSAARTASNPTAVEPGSTCWAR